jgi:hypothetical protein
MNIDPATTVMTNIPPPARNHQSQLQVNERRAKVTAKLTKKFAND